MSDNFPKINKILRKCHNFLKKCHNSNRSLLKTPLKLKVQYLVEAANPVAIDIPEKEEYELYQIFINSV